MDKLPLYKQITEYLKEQIKQREYTPGDQLPSESELNELFNVSRITSQRALKEMEQEGLIYREQGKGSFVSSEINPEELDHKENNTQKNIIAMVVPFGNSESWLLEVINGASEKLNGSDYHLSLFTTGKSSQKEKKVLLDLMKKNISGIIYYPNKTTKNFDIVHNIYLKKFPIVVIDKYFDGIPIHYVNSDNFRGGYLAAEYLVEMGHKNISFFSSISVEIRTSLRDRYLGFCQGLQDNGITINQKLFKFGTDNIDEGMEANNHFWKKSLKEVLHNNATAIFAENDWTATHLMHISSNININIPDDISIIGFDNIDYSASTNLTTINQDFHKMGFQAADVVLKLIQEKETENKNISLPVKLIKRDSVRKLK
ncbi:MAG: GntR family transcriptional regulator [bacterium]